jgi:hypothetical protein
MECNWRNATAHELWRWTAVAQVSNIIAKLRLTSVPHLALKRFQSRNLLVNLEPINAQSDFHNLLGRSSNPL